MSGGTLTLHPNTRKFGMCPVESWRVARKAAKAKLRCESQSLWWSLTVFAKILFIVRWNLSTWFVEGLYGVVRNFSILNILQTSFIIRPSTSLPWSDRIDNGVPNLLNTCSTKTLAMVSASLLRSGNVHFVNESIQVSIQMFPFSDFGWGPVRSMYHLSYGAPGTTGLSGPFLANLPLWYFVHSSHWRQKRFVSFQSDRKNQRRTWSMVFQNPKCPPTVPAWQRRSASSTSTLGNKKRSGVRSPRFAGLSFKFMFKKTTVLNTLVTMTMTSDVENSKN